MNNISKITLNGSTIINLVEGEKYNEPGYTETDENGKRTRDSVIANDMC